MTDYRAALLDKFRTRQAHVAVIGLGYVGLPLAVGFAEAGYRVTGIDLDARKIAAIGRGESYIEDVPAAAVAALVQAGRFTATTDPSALRDCDAASICVPTPLAKTGDPDISYIINAGEAVARGLHPGMVVVLESTTYPGTTTEAVLPLLANNGANLRVGEDFFLAFSPERVSPGDGGWTTRTMPKVIGGVTPACLEVATAYYSAAIDRLVPVSSTEAAEMVKLLENTFRAVNIGLVNEMLHMSDKLRLNIWEIIDAAATKPLGFMKFTPGPGLGGHCIPIDPLYLSWKMKSLNYTARFIELASEINTAMPVYWVAQVQDALNEAAKPVKGSAILVLGVAYKPNISDVRESPALDIIQLLAGKGAHVRYHDPHVPILHHEGIEMISVPDLPAALAAADCVVIATDHTAYDWTAIQAQARLIVDTRNALRHARAPQPAGVR